METTLRAIYIALQAAPVIAMLLILPYTIFNYVRAKRINVRSSTYIYVFILYFLCAYFMTMLPLPSAEDFADMRPVRELIQLVPFKSFFDIRSETVFRDVAILIFNVFITIPLGFFLRFLFGVDLKKTVLIGFLTALFYEVTQITGIFFIYPRPYRIFDVDDLIINTLGAIIGFWITPLLSGLLPDPQKNGRQLVQGSEVSLFQRCVAFFIDDCFILVASVATIAAVPFLRQFLMQSNHFFRFPVFYILFLLLGGCYSLLFAGGSPGAKLTGLMLMTKGGERASRGRCAMRFCLINSSVIANPFWVYFFMTVNKEYAGAASIIWVLFGALLMLCAAAVLLELTFNAVTHGSSMFYDRMLKTHIAYGYSRKSSLFGIRVIDVKPLCPANVDDFSEQIGQTLLSMGVPHESIVKVRLMAEGIMLDWIENQLENAPCELRLDKRFKRNALLLSVLGEDKTNEAVTDSYVEMLEGLSLEIEAYYAGDKNICNIFVPNAK